MTHYADLDASQKATIWTGDRQAAASDTARHRRSRVSDRDPAPAWLRPPDWGQDGSADALAHARAARRGVDRAVGAGRWDQLGPFALARKPAVILHGTRRTDEPFRWSKLEPQLERGEMSPAFVMI